MPRPSRRCGKPSRKLLHRTVERGHPSHTYPRKLTGHCVDSYRARCWVQIFWIGERCPSRMLKKSAISVLTSFRRSTLRRSFSEVRNAGGAFPFAKTHCKGERPTRSAVCTSSALHSLRPCWTAFLSILQGCFPILPHVRNSEVLAC
jgi:hypothetical protein